jgi:hypothetical protein
MQVDMHDRRSRHTVQLLPIGHSFEVAASTPVDMHDLMIGQNSSSLEQSSIIDNLHGRYLLGQHIESSTAGRLTCLDAGMDD